MTDAAAPITPALLRDREAATMCGISRSGWRKAHSAGRVPLPVRIGRSCRWRAEELRDWIAAGCPTRDRWAAAKK